jgi:hypothetical protein
MRSKKLAIILGLICLIYLALGIHNHIHNDGLDSIEFASILGTILFGISSLIMIFRKD